MATTLWLSLLLVASSSLLVQGSSIAPNQVLVDVRTPAGLEVFASDLEGSVAKAVFFRKESPVSFVILATGGRMPLIKSEYDNNSRLIDCDLVHSRADIERFANHVEDAIQTEVSKGGRHDKTRHWLEDFWNPFDLEAELQECERLLSRRREESGHRKKRSYLLWPGTNWCGKGSKAEFAENFGPNKEADQCCQKHDQCPYIIEGFNTRYNLFNYRMHTLSHCDCDVLFMNCLKTANTTTANMVAKVYFNVVNTECFVLNLQKSCARRSWWGGCEKYTTKWTATVKTLGNFPQ